MSISVVGISHTEGADQTSPEWMEQLMTFLSWGRGEHEDGGEEDEEAEEQDQQESIEEAEEEEVEEEEEEGIFDVDMRDAHNAQAATEYTHEIYEYLRERELMYLLDSNLFRGQPEVNEKMRLITVSWMFEVFLHLHLEHDTFFLSVQLLDRYLAKRIVAKNDLQLVATVCMYIAMKYEEIYHEPTKGCVKLLDGRNEKKDIVRTERKILQALNFELSAPITSQFHRRVSKIATVPTNVYWMSRYLLFLAFLSFQVVSRFRPSVLASACTYVSQQIFQSSHAEWTRHHEHHTGYSEADLVECALSLKNVLRAASGCANYYVVVRDTFAQDVYLEVAISPEVERYLAHD